VNTIKFLLLVATKRFLWRLRYAFRLREICTWKCESCRHCGINYRLLIGIRDDIWIAVNGKERGCLCVNCFLQIAQEKNIKILDEHIRKLYVFSSGFYIIDREPKV